MLWPCRHFLHPRFDQVSVPDELLAFSPFVGKIIGKIREPFGIKKSCWAWETVSLLFRASPFYCIIVTPCISMDDKRIMHNHGETMPRFSAHYTRAHPVMNRPRQMHFIKKRVRQRGSVKSIFATQLHPPTPDSIGEEYRDDSRVICVFVPPEEPSAAPSWQAPFRRLKYCTFQSSVLLNSRVERSTLTETLPTGSSASTG